MTVYLKPVSDGFNSGNSKIVLHHEHDYSHQNNRYQRSGYFPGNFWSEKNDGHTQHANACRPPIDGFQMLKIYFPFGKEIGRNLGYTQSKQVFYLRGENGKGNTTGEPNNNGVGNKLDDSPELENTH